MRHFTAAAFLLTTMVVSCAASSPRRRRLCGAAPPPSITEAVPAEVADPICSHETVELRNGSKVTPYCPAYNEAVFLKQNGAMATTITPVCFSDAQRLDTEANYCLSSSVFTSRHDRFVDIVTSSCPDHEWGGVLKVAAPGNNQSGRCGATGTGCCAAAAAGCGAGCEAAAGCCATVGAGCQAKGCCAVAAGAACKATGCCATAGAGCQPKACCATQRVGCKGIGCCSSSGGSCGSTHASPGSCGANAACCGSSCSGLPAYTPARHTVHLRIPVLPRVVPGGAGEPSATSGDPDAPVAILANGVVVYNHTPAPSFDSCLGHVDADHHYHYHSVPRCLLSRMGVTMPASPEIHASALLNMSSSVLFAKGGAATTMKQVLGAWPQTGTPSPIVGWALDGFPIFGPYDEDGRLQVAPAAELDAASITLDACHGKRLADGHYAYFMAPNARHVLGCFRGTPGQARDAGRSSFAAAAEGGAVGGSCPRHLTTPIYVSCPRGSRCDPSVAAGWSAKMYCGEFRGSAGKEATSVVDTNLSLVTIFLVPWSICVVLVLAMFLQHHAQIRHAYAQQQRIRRAFKGTMTAPEEKLFDTVPQIRKCAYVWIYFLTISSVFICPLIIITANPILRFFYPNSGGTVPDSFHEGLANFLTPAALVYAIVFGATYQTATEKQHELGHSVTTEISDIDSVVQKVNHIHIRCDDAYNILLTLRRASLLLLGHFKGGKRSMEYETEYLQCISAVQNHFLDIATAHDISSSNTDRPPEEGWALTTIDQFLLQGMIDTLYQLEQSANSRVSIVSKRIGFMTWAFLEILGLIVFFAIIFIDVGSPRMAFTMCLATAITIGLLTLVIQDLDDPFHGAFNIHFVSGQAEDVINTICAAIRVNRSLESHQKKCKYLDRKSRFEKVANFYDVRTQTGKLLGRHYSKVALPDRHDNPTLRPRTPSQRRRRSVEELQRTLMTPYLGLVSEADDKRGSQRGGGHRLRVRHSSPSLPSRDIADGRHYSLGKASSGGEAAEDSKEVDARHLSAPPTTAAGSGVVGSAIGVVSLQIEASPKPGETSAPLPAFHYKRGGGGAVV